VAFQSFTCPHALVHWPPVGLQAQLDAANGRASAEIAALKQQLADGHAVAEERMKAHQQAIEVATAAHSTATSEAASRQALLEGQFLNALESIKLERAERAAALSAAVASLEAEAATERVAAAAERSAAAALASQLDSLATASQAQVLTSQMRMSWLYFAMLSAFTIIAHDHRPLSSALPLTPRRSWLSQLS
jgi:hypothetical protein